MVAEVAGGDILFVPLAPANNGNPTKARPIGIDVLRNPATLAQYLELR